MMATAQQIDKTSHRMHKQEGIPKPSSTYTIHIIYKNVRIYVYIYTYMYIYVYIYIISKLYGRVNIKDIVSALLHLLN